MRRAFAPRAVAAATALAAAQQRTFFGKGWDNAALDTTFRAVLRKPAIVDVIGSEYARTLDGRILDQLRKVSDLGAKSAKETASPQRATRVYLPPHLGDAHRVLKAYSLTAYPILDESGAQMKVDVGGQEMDAFADPDDDYAKVVIPQQHLVEALAAELLSTLGWEATPRGAASLLESLYRGAEIPDHVFQTPAVIERF